MGASAMVLVLGACAPPAAPADGGPEAVAVRLPPAGALFDSQLGGAYDPPAGASVVVRDSTEDPAPDAYSICYVNGFQTQPGEGAHWLDEHPELVLRDDSGDPVVDPGWPDEYLLDTSTAGRRERIAAILGTVVASCATRGFDAVEIDNLDSWTRSGGALDIEGAVDLAARYARVSHSLGLAIAQKNAAEWSGRLRDEVGFDFAVTEECMRYEECGAYLEAYDGLVYDIEYGSADEFAAACANPARPASMIRRDAELAPAGSPGYVFETC